MDFKIDQMRVFLKLFMLCVSQTWLADSLLHIWCISHLTENQYQTSTRHGAISSVTFNSRDKVVHTSRLRVRSNTQRKWRLIFIACQCTCIKVDNDITNNPSARNIILAVKGVHTHWTKAKLFFDVCCLHWNTKNSVYSTRTHSHSLLLPFSHRYWTTGNSTKLQVLRSGPHVWLGYDCNCWKSGKGRITCTQCSNQ